MMHDTSPLDIEDIFSDVSAPLSSPEEGEERIERPIRRHTLTIFFSIAVLLFLLLAGRMFSLTVLKGDVLSAVAQHSRERVSTVPPPRGIILDQAGRVLVENKEAFVLVFDPLLARMLPDEVQERAFAQAGELLYVSKDALKEAAAPFLKQAEPRVIFEGVGREQAVALSVGELPDFLRVEKVYNRVYPNGGEALAHTLGYVGRVSQEELEQYEGYSPRDTIGKAGIERFYESVLRGVPGERRVVVDAQGRAQGEPTVREPVAGKRVQLTVDAQLAGVLAGALREEMEASSATGAAAVALDPRNGAVRALVSLPAYDAAAMSNGVDPAVYQRLVEDQRNPFLHRAIAGVYPTGSTVKPFVAAATLSEGVVGPYRTIDASKGYIRVTSIYNPDISWTFHDWKPHGFVNVFEALARSANVYFYVVGGGYEGITGLGIEKMVQHLFAFGFGRTLGIDLFGEASGRIPTPEWKKETIEESWYIGDTYNLAIGQGYFGATPLQLASATAAVVNGGTLYQPHLLQGVEESEEENNGEQLGRVPASQEALDAVRRGMRLAVTAPYGTNRSLNELPVAVAAKTGTAQFGNEGKTHALVTAFVPYENPELVLAVVLEGGGQGTVATEVVKRVLAWYATESNIAAGE